MNATQADVTRVTYRWDEQPGIDPGWYCESYDANGFRDDSQKIWFPVQADSFDCCEEPELRAALREAFPNAEIVG